MTEDADPDSDSASGGLTDRQMQFVREYLVDFNATQAAVRAGYSEATADQQGSRLLKNVKVAAALKLGRDALARRTEITADAALQQMARFGYGDLRRIFDGSRLKLPHEWDDDTAASISSVEVVTRGGGEGEVEYVSKIRSVDKRAAVSDILRCLGAYKDSLEVKHLGAVFITPQWMMVQTAIMRALEPYPEARAAVLHALEGVG
jgi:phage terminase small subunit